MKHSMDYRADLLDRLGNDPGYAVEYLNAAIQEGRGAFLVALRDVVDALGGPTVFSRAAGVHRVSVYKMLSEGGNPTFENLENALDAAGLQFFVAHKNQERKTSA